jgi:RNA polymerase sigma factor (sigma-70 family)
MNELELIAAAARGDSSATRRLVERLLPVVRARIRRLQVRRADLRRHETSDLVQQVFLCLLEDGARQLRQWEPTRGASLEGYVGMVTEREVGNTEQRAVARARHETPANDIEALSPQPSPEAQTVARDVVDRLGAFLARELPPKGQVVFRCLYTDGLDAEETARMLGVNRQVVYNWQHRIREVARRFLPTTT